TRPLFLDHRQFGLHQLYWPALNSLRGHSVRWIILILFIFILPLFAQESSMQTPSTAPHAAAVPPAWMQSSSAKLETALVSKYGEQQRTRAQRGIKQVAEFWRAEDGDA